MNTVSFTKSKSDLPLCDFWMICSSFGVVSLCSPKAADLGIIPGKSRLSDILVPVDRLTAEDSMRQYGEFSLCLRVLPRFGYSVAHIKKTVVFSSEIIEVQLYKSKDSLTASVSENEETRTLLPSIGDKVSELAILADSANLPEELSMKLSHLAREIGRLLADEELLICHLNNKSGDTVFDAAAVLRRIEDSVNTLYPAPFRVDFMPALSETVPICHGRVWDFVGICFISFTVAAKLSRDRRLCVSVVSDGDDTVLEICADTERSISFVGRIFHISHIGALFPHYPGELMLLETLVSSDNCTFYFERSSSGRITLHFSFAAASDPFRLKYRDYIADADSAIDHYSKHLSAILSDTEE